MLLAVNHLLAGLEAFIAANLTAFHGLVKDEIIGRDGFSVDLAICLPENALDPLD